MSPEYQEQVRYRLEGKIFQKDNDKDWFMHLLQFSYFVFHFLVVFHVYKILLGAGNLLKGQNLRLLLEVPLCCEGKLRQLCSLFVYPPPYTYVPSLKNSHKVLKHLQPDCSKRRDKQGKKNAL